MLLTGPPVHPLVLLGQRAISRSTDPYAKSDLLKETAGAPILVYLVLLGQRAICEYAALLRGSALARATSSNTAERSSPSTPASIGGMLARAFSPANASPAWKGRSLCQQQEQRSLCKQQEQRSF